MFDIGELPPGVTPRRWIPKDGLQKHREKIHRESKMADKKNLPFTFSKPKRNKRSDDFECAECRRVFTASVNTVMCICPDCKKVTKAVRINNEELACLDDRSK